MNAINEAGTIRKPYPTQDSLFFKIQGAPEVISGAAEALETIVKKYSGSRFEFASTEEDGKVMWENRKMALFSSLELEPGLRCWTTDVWSVAGFCAEICSVLTANQRSGLATPCAGIRNQEGPRRAWDKVDDCWACWGWSSGPLEVTSSTADGV